MKLYFSNYLVRVGFGSVIIRVVINLVVLVKAIWGLHHDQDNSDSFYLEFFHLHFRIIFSSSYYFFAVFQSHFYLYTLSNASSLLNMSTNWLSIWCLLIYFINDTKTICFGVIVQTNIKFQICSNFNCNHFLFSTHLVLVKT